MRNYIYKIIIAVIALIIVFEFTIGKTLNKITSQTDSFFTREGRRLFLQRWHRKFGSRIFCPPFMLDQARYSHEYHSVKQNAGMSVLLGFVSIFSNYR